MPRIKFRHFEPSAEFKSAAQGIHETNEETDIPIVFPEKRRAF